MQITHHDASIGSGFLTTRNMYSTQVISLNNKFAIRIRKPEREKNLNEIGSSAIFDLKYSYYNSYTLILLVLKSITFISPI